MEVHLMSYGAKVSVKDGLFLITYFDEKQRRRKQEIAPVELRSIWLHDSSALTTAAVALALEHDVDMVITDKRGHPLGRFMPHKPSSTSHIQKGQLIASQQETAVQYVKNWILQKLRHQADFLTALQKMRQPEVQERLKKAKTQILGFSEKIAKLEARHIDEIAPKLRGLEGNACRVYFQILSSVLASTYQFDGRSRRPAQDVFNAMLNYGYAILYSRVERALTKAGVNPYLGFLHRDGHQYKSMVYDFIEPYRIGVDRNVFGLFSQKLISGVHWQKQSNKLQLTIAGKRMLIEKLNDYYDKKKSSYNNKHTTHQKILELEAQAFAQELKYYVPAKLEALADV